MKVRTIEFPEAREHIERWHYSGNVPKGKNLFFGWYDQDELYAVANYGLGVNPYQAQYLARVTELPVTGSNFLELKRLCRSEPPRDVYLSQFLAQCHRLLRADGYRFIVSFSDPEYGHSGGIYRASNFTHLGQTGAEMHVVDGDGVRRHRRYPYRYAKRNGCTIGEARDFLGLTRVRTQPKDRWFLKI